MSHLPARTLAYSSPPATTTTARVSPPSMAATQTLPSLGLPFFDAGAVSDRTRAARIQLPPLTTPPNLVHSDRPLLLDHFRSQHSNGSTPASTLQTAPGTIASLGRLLAPAPQISQEARSLHSPDSPSDPGSDPRLHHWRYSATNHGSSFDNRQKKLYQSSSSPTADPLAYKGTSSLALGHAYKGSRTQQDYRHIESIPSPPQILRTLLHTSQSHHVPNPRPVSPPPPPRIIPSYSPLPPPPQLPDRGRDSTGARHTSRSSHQETVHGTEDLHYELIVRQHPMAARACGFGERDRRYLDPPPIIQLLITDSQRRRIDLDELRYSLHVVYCTLWSADGTHDETALTQHDRRGAISRLVGQHVASPSVAKDEHDNEGCFFCFPELSVRTHGRYRLRLVLMRIDTANLVPGSTSPVLTEVLTDVFTVYTAKEFPGLRTSSALTRALKLQGCNIQVRKGNERTLTRKRSAIGSEEVEDEETRAKRLRGGAA